LSSTSTLFHAQADQHGAVAPDRASFGQLIFNGPVFNTHYATRDRFQIETFRPVYWTANKLPAVSFRTKRAQSS
jgi:hypothetical protein